MAADTERDLKVLIVEDVPQDAQAMEAALVEESIRFRSRRSETREEFLTALREFAPDIILSDFTLPKFDALEALRLLREHHYDIPLILVTGSRSEEVAVECIKEGAEDYILKASLRRLPSSVHNVLQRRAAERERWAAEAALRRTEEQFRLIAEHSHDLISLLDVDARFLYASPSFGKALGHVPEELLGTSCYALVHTGDQNALGESLQRARSACTGVSAEYRYRHQGGSWPVFESTATWIYDEHGAPQRCVLVSRDITQRKQTEELLRRLPQLIRETQEAERHRVARDLHDSVNQMLAAAKFRVQTVEDRLLETDPAAWRETLKTKALLEQAMREVRRISRNLRPSELDDLGLIPAVRSLCKEFAERTGIKLELNLRQPPEGIPDALELDLYRIVQEALANIEKHARSSRVQIRVSRIRRMLQIRISDNGRGFDPTALRVAGSGRPGMGLVDMRERAAFNGGCCRISTAPDHGTEILVQVPLQSPHPIPPHARQDLQS